MTCEICLLQGQLGQPAHWRWHDYCRAEVNPVALVQFIDLNPDAAAIRRYVVAITGMDVEAALAAAAQR